MVEPNYDNLTIEDVYHIKFGEGHYKLYIGIKGVPCPFKVVPDDQVEDSVDFSGDELIEQSENDEQLSIGSQGQYDIEAMAYQ